MQNYLIKNISIVNEGTIVNADVFIRNGRIEKIGQNLQPGMLTKEINGEGKHLLPGAIDDQVHFRDPGLTHKATIYSESRAAVAGGITSFMEMPNTIPPVFTQTLLDQKYEIGAANSLANYSFYMGTSNENVEEVLRTNERRNEVCGIKIFMGSSTGNLLVDNYLTLDRLFRECELLIATHCEDEKVIRENLARIKQEHPRLTAADHPLIRDEVACFESSLTAIQFAKKYDSRLHIFHLSTEKEMQLFSNMVPLKDKRITSEICVHHLHFTADDYAQLGNRIKCNPAIKAAHNQGALWEALLDDRLDVIATDHAPHTMQEKGFTRNANGLLVAVPEDPAGLSAYEKAHAGLPLVQHAVLLMLHYVKEGKITLEKMVEKMSHAVAVCFQVKDRGFIREGYFADLVIVDLDASTTVEPGNILYKCGWSPFESTQEGKPGFRFPAAITHTFVNGHLAYGNNTFDESILGQRLLFSR